MKSTATALAITATAIALAGCGTSIKSATDTSPPAAASSIPGVTPVPASPSPDDSTSDANLDGPAGTTYTVTGSNGPNGSTTSYDVTMVRAVQHATLGQYGQLTNGGDHVTAAEFTIAGKSGQTSDNANSDAVAVGTDGQDYTSAYDTITEGTNFDSGDFHVGPGQSVTGWVTFELPAGVKIASVQWTPGGGQTATWQA